MAFSWERHVKLGPVETNTAGVYLAACARGQGYSRLRGARRAAAAKALALFSKPKLENDPQVSVVDIKRCVGCGKCIKVCPYQAIKETVIRGETKAEVVETVCQGCGLVHGHLPAGGHSGCPFHR